MTNTKIGASWYDSFHKRFMLKLEEYPYVIPVTEQEVAENDGSILQAGLVKLQTLR